MSDDIVFIKDKSDYNKFNKLKPKNKYKSTKIKFICSCCGEESIKQFRALKYPFICTKCLHKINAKNPEIIEHRKQTNIKRFGTDNPWKSKDIIEKRKQTCIERYGADNPQKAKCIREQRNVTEQLHLIEKYNNIIPETLLSYDYKVYTGICNICGRQFSIDKDIFYTRVINHKTKVCPYCNPISSTSSGKEKQLKDFISEIYKDIIIFNSKSIIKNRELDIYLPKLKLAFEFDGNYWHADPRLYKSDDIIEHKSITAKEIWERDKEKDILCELSDIKLIRVKEYDWDNNQNKIKEEISNIINKILHN